MPWTQTARDRRELEEELRQQLEQASQELDQAMDEKLGSEREPGTAA